MEKTYLARFNQRLGRWRKKTVDGHVQAGNPFTQKNTCRAIENETLRPTTLPICIDDKNEKTKDTP